MNRNKRSKSVAKKATTYEPKDQRSDCDSLENHTNLNWCTGATLTKRRKGDQLNLGQEEIITIRGGQDKQIDEAVAIQSKEFYQSSHYFIDQLKGEYCTDKGDGWFEVKDQFKMEEVANLESLKATDPSNDALAKTTTFAKGKWSDKEHRLFLEALRLFGKDWTQITAHIPTRDTKAVVSHGQKFLIRLVKFLSREERLDELSWEEAEYYHGVLSKKIHWMTRMKEERIKQKALQPVFKVQKVDRTAEAVPKVEAAEGLSSYTKWKEAIPGADKESFHRSLGHSLKLTVVEEEGLCKLSFKQVVEYQEEEKDDDSAQSQSSAHFRKFFVDEGYSELLQNQDLYLQFTQMIMSAFNDLPDIKPNQVVELMVKIRPNGPVFNVFEGQSAGNMLTNLHQSQKQTSFTESHPNLLEFMRKRMGDSLKEEGFLMKEDRQFALSEYIGSLSADELRELIEKGLDIYYEGPDYPRQDAQEGEAKILESQMHDLSLAEPEGSQRALD